MATSLHMTNTAAIEPRPNAMVDNTNAYTGTYSNCFDALEPAPAGSNARLDRAFLFGQSNNASYIRLCNGLSPKLVAQSIASQTWQVLINGNCLTTAPTIATFKFVARIFIWDDDTDALASFVAALGKTAALTTTATEYTLNFTASASIAEGQRLGWDVYVEAQDNVSEAALNYTARYMYNGATAKSRLISPATLIFQAGGAATVGTAYTP